MTSQQDDQLMNMNSYNVSPYFVPPVYKHHTGTQNCLYLTLRKYYLHPGSVHFWITESRTSGNSESKQHFAKVYAILFTKSFNNTLFIEIKRHETLTMVEMSIGHIFRWPTSTRIKRPGNAHDNRDQDTLSVIAS